MENGFHGKLEGKVVEVVLAPDAMIEKDGKNITIKEIVAGNSALVQGTKMPGNKIGASKVVVEKQEDEETGTAHSDHSDHDHSSNGEH